MGFVICAKDRESGDTIVLGQRWFASKDEAIAALSEREMLRDVPVGDLFLVDLDAATPVVIVPGLLEETVPVEEAPVEVEAFISVEPSVYAEPSPYESVTPSVDEPLAPLFTEPEPEPEPALFVLTATVDQSPFDDQDTEPPVEESSEMWWLETGSTPEEEHDVAELLAEAGHLPEGGGEPGDEVPAVEQPSLYEDLSGDSAAGATEVELPAEDAGAAQEPHEEPVFVRVDFEAWTCEDCVFVTTCDRVGIDRPATCASFQWRAG